MMDRRLLAEAKKDIPLYFEDFKKFWNLTTEALSEKDLINCYATTLVFKNWQISLNRIGISSLDGILLELHEDINAAFYRAYFGNYRSSHMHLRSVIELSLQLIFFYQHEVEYEQWRNGEFRIRHEDIVSYLKKHPNLKESSITNLIDEITKNWKLFSKYIHGEAPKYFQTNLQSSQTKKISKTDLGIWKGNYLKTAYLLNKLLLFFFRSKLNSFPTVNRNILLRNMKVVDLSQLGISTK